MPNIAKEMRSAKIPRKAPRKSDSTRIRTAGHSEIDEKGVPRQRQTDAPGMEMEMHLIIFMTYEAATWTTIRHSAVYGQQRTKLELDQQEEWIRTE